MKYLSEELDFSGLLKEMNKPIADKYKMPVYRPDSNDMNCSGKVIWAF